MKNIFFIALFIYLSNETKNIKKYVYQEKQNKFSCKHRNTWKSMEFSEGGE